MVSQEKVMAIKMLVCGVDGVLTDGTVAYGSGNMEIRTFNVRDGLAMKMAVWSDFPVAWLTGRISNPITRRADELDVKVYAGIPDKAVGLRIAARDFGCGFHEIAYIGDDINDLPALELVGLPIAVNDAVPEVLAAAALVTKASGGQGAVREALEFIFHQQGTWGSAMKEYLEHLRGSRISAHMPRTEE